MAYNNPFLYNRDQSISNQYDYVEDLSIYKPVYSSSVNFSSRLNFLKTVDNSLKILPASENNLRIEFNLKFLLDNELALTRNIVRVLTKRAVAHNKRSGLVCVFSCVQRFFYTVSTGSANGHM